MNPVDEPTRTEQLLHDQAGADPAAPLPFTAAAPPPPLDRAMILAAVDLAPLPVDVPEWGGRVYVRHITAGERDEWESMGEPGRNEARARAVAFCACDQRGRRLFTAADIPALAGKNADAIDRIFYAAVAANRVSAAELEAAEGKSAGGPSSAS